MDINFTFHIGFPKSASTTLQKSVFSRSCEIDYYGSFPTQNIGRDSKYNYNKSIKYLHDKNVSGFYKFLLNTNNENYNEETAKCMLSNLLQSIDASKKIVFSSEMVLSKFFSYPDIDEKINRISKLFYNPKILIIIRNQINLIKSQYRDHPFYPTSNFNGKYMAFDKWVEVFLSNFDGSDFLDSLKYDILINKLNLHFSPDNVKVLLFEDLVADLDFFSLELADFIGISNHETKNLLFGAHENIGVTTAQFYSRVIQRTFPNRYFQNLIGNIPHSFLLYGPSVKVKISNSTRHRLEEFFKHSNYNLSKFISRVSYYKYPGT